MTIELNNLEYHPKWLKYGFISSYVLKKQSKEFAESDDKNPEHYRYRTITRWINNHSKFTDLEIDRFIELIKIDNDQVMAGSALADLYKSEKYSKQQKIKLETALKTFGDWAIKLVERNTSR